MLMQPCVQLDSNGALTMQLELEVLYSYVHAAAACTELPLTNCWTAQALARAMQVTYQTTSNVAVQDAIGHCVLGAARIVPDGMLVFFSSYSLLDRLVQRWQASSCPCARISIAAWSLSTSVFPNSIVMLSCSLRAIYSECAPALTEHLPGNVKGRAGYGWQSN